MGESNLETTSVINFKSPPLPFFIEIMQSVIHEGKSYPSRSHLGIFNFIYVRKGKLFISEQDEQFEVSAGDYIVLRPDTKCISYQPCEVDTVIEDIQFSATGQWEQLDVHSTPTLFGDYYSQLLHMKKKHSVKQRKKLDTICEKLRRAATSGEADAFLERQQHFINLLKLIDDEWRQSDAKATVVVAEKAASYIKEHFSENLSNAMLAQDIGYHINYITRSMDEVFKMTPQQYLMYYRLDQAKLMLIRTDYTIGQIAQQTGFKQTPHFSRLFAYYVGLTPLKYRKKYTT